MKMWKSTFPSDVDFYSLEEKNNIYFRGKILQNFSKIFYPSPKLKKTQKIKTTLLSIFAA